MSTIDVRELVESINFNLNQMVNHYTHALEAVDRARPDLIAARRHAEETQDIICKLAELILRIQHATGARQPNDVVDLINRCHDGLITINQEIEKWSSFLSRCEIASTSNQHMN